jgi:hypothetical protein
MKYAVKMDSDVIIYNTKFHKQWFRRSKVNRGEFHTHAERKELS